ncbi:hypothetical protein SAMN04488008_101655 [Maribacter orientalis]|uniref:Uncharacterized protein n=1 Tax=Maribacter orientalis TaxID=228957 RepID=A0A1H7HVN8_9FLAO|nr:hypothetical protein [Maribacter orientalis]SEK53190.1 hypothetical protein SAMN04488008_101655 [Maribacter orientalis]
MKRFFVFTICCFLFSVKVAHSQNFASKNVNLESEEEPIMFQFEPNFETARLQKREALLSKIKQIYKESHTDKFQKNLLVDTEFGDDKYQ